MPICRGCVNPVTCTGRVSLFQIHKAKTELLSFSSKPLLHLSTSQVHFYFKNTLKNAIQTNGENPKLPLSVAWCGRPSNTPIHQLTQLTTPNGNSIASHTFTQVCNKVPISYNGTSHIHPQNCTFPSTDLHPYIIHSSLDHTNSPPKTASRSNQPFSIFHPLHRPKDRQTDRQMV